MVIETRAALKITISHELGLGKSSAITGRLLSKRLGINNRQIRRTIQELIEDGIPICGSSIAPYGYFIADSAKECKDNLDTLMSYIKHLAIHHKQLLRASQNILKPEQLHMSLYRGDTIKALGGKG